MAVCCRGLENAESRWGLPTVPGVPSRKSPTRALPQGGSGVENHGGSIWDVLHGKVGVLVLLEAPL